MKAFAASASLSEKTDVNGTTSDVKIKGVTHCCDVEPTFKKIDDLADLADALGVRDIKIAVIGASQIDIEIKNHQTELPTEEEEKE